MKISFNLRSILLPVGFLGTLLYGSLHGSPALAQVPSAWDWRDADGVNCVSGVRNMAACSACYIFAPVAMVESRLMIEKYRLGLPVVETDLSEQYILSCGSGYFGDFGCEGGFPRDTLDFLSETGAPLEACFEYVAADAVCPGDCPDSGEPLVLYKPVIATEQLYPFPAVETLMQEIFQNGPIVTTIDVYGDLTSYVGGIYRYTSGDYHGSKTVTIVGWGEEAGTPYWIVKFDWGTYFGEDGFVRIVRDGSDGIGICEWVWSCSVTLAGMSATPPVQPTAFLGQNHPNPFNPSTTIRYRLPQAGPASLRIYDAAGRLVHTLVDGVFQEASTCEAVWNGRNEAGAASPAGVYYYRLESVGFRAVDSMVLLK